MPGRWQAAHEADQRARSHVAADTRAPRTRGSTRCGELETTTGSIEAEEAADVVADLLGGGRGERHDRRSTERAQALADAEIGGAEIVAPFRDAVRLVDRCETDPGLAERCEELGRAERLGRRHEEHRSALLEPLERRAPRLAADRAVEPDHRDVELRAASCAGPRGARGAASTRRPVSAAIIDGIW